MDRGEDEDKAVVDDNTSLSLDQDAKDERTVLLVCAG